MENTKNVGPMGSANPANPGHVTRRSRGNYWNLSRVLVAAGALGSVAVPAIMFGPSAFIFLGPLVIPPVVGAALVLWRERQWTYLTGAVLGSLLPVIITTFEGILAGQLFQPLNTMQFMAYLVLIMCGVMVWAGGLSGRHALAADRPRNSLTSGWLTPSGLTTLLVASLLVGSMATSVAAKEYALTTAGGTYHFAPDASQNILIEDFLFHPQEIQIAAGEVTELVFDNQDDDRHTFTYARDGVTYNKELVAASTTTLLVLFDEPGTYKVWCVPHSTGPEDDGDGMIATMVVA